MRTTVTLTPEADAPIRRMMRERGLTFADAVDAAILGGLRPASEHRHSTPTFDLGGARRSLDEALALSGELEDEELLRRREVGT